MIAKLIVADRRGRLHRVRIPEEHLQRAQKDPTAYAISIGFNPSVTAIIEKSDEVQSKETK